MARIVVPGVPLHVTQRGNRRQKAFFRQGDYRAYIGMMAEECKLHGIEVWAYCLMPNHVHLVVVPAVAPELSRGIGEGHRRYTDRVNKRNGWKGFLWQGRFGSYPMDENHMLCATRYIERNPVAAGLVRTPEAYPWSSARAHLSETDDALVRVVPLLEKVGDWRKFLSQMVLDEEVEDFRRHSRTGRPLGDDRFIESLERATGRVLRRMKPGRKRKGDAGLPPFGVSN